MIDTHSHIYLKDFKSELRLVCERARDVGVEKIFLPNIDSDTIEDLKALADTEEMCYPMMGMHPSSVDGNWKQELQKITDEINANPEYYVAIGEIGLDLYWEQKFLNQQKEVFKEQILLARNLNLPIVIHCRNAFEEIFEVLDEVALEGVNGIFHCFTGNVDQAKKALSYGLKLGIGGIVTFRNAGLDKVVENLHLKDLVLETDAPYLAPAPYRGKRNEPSYLPFIAGKVAELLNVSVKQVEEVTNRNAREIFKL